jgi:2-polyprenyl-3-methyl-5-hydroxy-6-metoxy-1,4-benzoquinol methylase
MESTGKDNHAGDRGADEAPCSLCGGGEFSALFSAGDFDSGREQFTLIKCIRCGLVRIKQLANVDLSTCYDQRYYGGGQSKFIGVAEKWTNWFNDARARSILACLRRTGGFPADRHPSILDVGCGRGSLLKTFARMGCECCGVERTEFPPEAETQGIRFHRGTMEEISFEPASFDVLVLWHVLEHLEDPIAMLREVNRILRPGGILAVAVPNFGSFQARLFRRHWFHLDVPRHTHHFDPDTLVRSLGEENFRIMFKSTFSLEQNPFGFIQSLFNAAVPSAAPNRFYALLKKRNARFSLPALLFWSMLACMALPLALLDYLVAGLAGAGATMIIYAEKCAFPRADKHSD